MKSLRKTPCFVCVGFIALFGLAKGGAGEILDDIKAHNSLWLAPDANTFPRLSYTYRSGGEVKRLSFDTMPELHMRRGTPLRIGLVMIAESPGSYTARKRYEGRYGGRDVLVLDVTGPRVRLIFYGGGYVETGGDKIVLVVEKATSRPLVAAYAEYQFFFLNYVEARPGQHVPLRIVLRSKNGWTCEYRFQLVDDRVWLSEDFVEYNGVVAGPIENVKLDGKPATKVRRATGVKPLTALEVFDFNQIADLRGATPEEQVVAELFNRNRAWLYPPLDHLESVEFVHRVERPLDEERFAWRSDGASLVSVGHGDETSRKWWLTMPDGAYYYHPANDRFAHAVFEHNLRQSITTLPIHYRRSLMGARLDFLLLAWAQRPQSVLVQDVAEETSGVYRLVVAPPDTRYWNCPVLNVGAVFHDHSWPLAVGIRWVYRGEISVDGTTFRPIREVDHMQDYTCQITFADYQEIGGGQAVPRRIHARVAARRAPDIIESDYRFEWRPERLWILKSAETRIVNKDEPPRIETISGLKINEPVDSTLERELALVELTREIHGSTVPAQLCSLAACPFHLGRRMTFAGRVPQEGTPWIRDLLLRLDDDESLVADIGLADGQGELDPADSILLALFDEGGLPVGALETSLGAAALGDRPAASILEAVRAHNAFWLLPDLDGFTTITFDRCFYDGKTTEPERVAMDRRLARAFPWGEAMKLGLETMVARPLEYRAPIAFEGRLDGRNVVVAAVAGPEMDLRWGVSYVDEADPTCAKPRGLLVIDRATSTPLIARYDDFEFHFLNYIEVGPKRYAPLRVLDLSGDSSYPGDFRFQIVNGRRWFFAGSGYGATYVRTVRNLRIDGQPVPVRHWTGPVRPVEEIPKLDITRITNRRSLNRGEDERIREVIARPVPWEHPLYDQLLNGYLRADPDTSATRLRVNFGRWPVLGHSRYAVLARRPKAGAPAIDYAKLKPPANSPFAVERFSIPTYPFHENVPLRIDVQPGKGDGWPPIRNTYIKRARFERNEAGELLARAEVISRDCGFAFDAAVSVILLDANDTMIAAATGRFTRYVDIYIGSTDDVVLNLGRPDPARPPVRFHLGLKLDYVTSFMGSMWEPAFRTMRSFPISQYLGSVDAREWRIGLEELDTAIRQLFEDELFDPDDSERAVKEGRTRAKQLAPHVERLGVLLKLARDPDLLVSLCRLFGHSGDRRFRKDIAPLLDHPNPAVKDAAAVGLGLLGDAVGFERLGPILDRPVPDDWVEHSKAVNWQIDAALALSEIASDRAVDRLGRFFLARVDAEIKAYAAEQPDYGFGTHQLVHVLGRTDNSRVLRFFRRAAQKKIPDRRTISAVRHYIDVHTSELVKFFRRITARMQGATGGP